MSRQHYVSRFHLSAFCDPASTGTRDPWLWIGSTADQSVRRRSPKNVATVPGLFDGPGGFSDPEASLETFLANDVEGPAAAALRRLLQSTSIEHLPPEVMRYLAWAASRSLPMQRLEADWATRYRPTLNGPMAEPPPPALAALQPRHRSIRLIHPVLGERREISSQAADEFLDDGWILTPPNSRISWKAFTSRPTTFRCGGSLACGGSRCDRLRASTSSSGIAPSVGACRGASMHRLAACATKQHFSLLLFHEALRSSAGMIRLLGRSLLPKSSHCLLRGLSIGSPVPRRTWLPMHFAIVAVYLCGQKRTDVQWVRWSPSRACRPSLSLDLKHRISWPR